MEGESLTQVQLTPEAIQAQKDYLEYLRSPPDSTIKGNDSAFPTLHDVVMTRIVEGGDKSSSKARSTPQANPTQLDASLASPAVEDKRIRRQPKTSFVGTVNNTPVTKAPWLSGLLKKFSLSETIKKLRNKLFKS